MPILTEKCLSACVHRIVSDQPVTDLHTHVFSPVFGVSPEANAGLLWGIDELLTYHYLIAEVFRVVPATVMSYDAFYGLGTAEQADYIWEHLFVRRGPMSEATRGVVTTLCRLGLDPKEKTLGPYRKYFASLDADGYVDLVMKLANVDQITMTNEVFDSVESELWLGGADVGGDDRFACVLRIDALLLDWSVAREKLVGWGYAVGGDLEGVSGGDVLVEVRRFLNDWIDRIKPVYVATSLPPSFCYPMVEGSWMGRLIDEALLPVLADRGLAWALMIGAVRGTNAGLGVAGDSLGLSDVDAVVNLCRGYGNNKFMVTMLARENQHELAVVSRKFGNLLPFGCWWYLNNPSLITEMTRMRLELLGTTFSPQHSDARILDQLIYKWDHSRKIIGNVLVEKYRDLMAVGYEVTSEEVEADVKRLLRDTYREFVGLPL